MSDIGFTARVNMPVVILFGGLGSRLREETVVRAKPMVKAGGRPVHFGYRRFVLPDAVSDPPPNDLVSAWAGQP